jgi:type I restriction enzyme M protein
METKDRIIHSIWVIADLIRDFFPRGKYQDIILPFTFLRRLDSILEPTKDKVLAVNRELGSSLGNPDELLRKASGYAFYNTSPYTFARLTENKRDLVYGLRTYINCFSNNIQEIFENFDFDHTISQLEEEKLLYPLMWEFKNIDLSSDKVSNHIMQAIFKETIIKFNNLVNERAGFYAPNEVIQLMVAITLSKDSNICSPSIVRKVYDPCCGAGSMLSIAKEEICKINPDAQVFLFGQEVHRETFALCKSNLYMKSMDGNDAENIFFGSTLSNERLPDERYDYIYANPPFGMSWKPDENAVRHEAERGPNGRFGAGLPRISDAQLLFLQHALSRMKAPGDGTSHVAIIMSGSPLFTGDAGSGESEIRRWILENDWLEAIIALPEQLFYSTGIATYIWILTNHKTLQRKGKVQLINATDLWLPMPKSGGSKRRYMSDEQIARIRDLFVAFKENEHSKILPCDAFGYRKIIVERPLRLNFQISPERLALLEKQRAFADLAVSKKKHPIDKAVEEEEGTRLQAAIRAALQAMSTELFKNRNAFEQELDRVLKAVHIRLAPVVRKAILNALAERDEMADICRDKAGRPEPDPELRDTENVPLPEDGKKVEHEYVFDGYTMDLSKSIIAFFEREIKPYVPDAWISPEVRDSKDRNIGKIGYEIDFSFYRSLMYQYKIEGYARNLGIRAALLSEFVRTINFTNAKDGHGFEEYPNAIYFPLHGMSEVITTISQDSSKKPSHYAQIVFDPNQAIASYIAQFLNKEIERNKEIGRLIRSQVMVGVHRAKFFKGEIAQLPICFPEIDIQEKTIEIDTKITNIISELRELEELAWSKPRKLEGIASRINAFKRQERPSDWLNYLPFPLASILWRYHALGNDYKRKYETLLHFFEALAEFMANLLLSAFFTEEEDLFREKCQQLRKSSPSSLEKATFGTWVKIVEYLSKESRTLLHGKKEDEERCMTIFKTRNRETLEMLFSKEIITILQETNTRRNQWRGHGGITNSSENYNRHNELENHLSKLRSVFTTKWDKYVLIRPGTCKHLSGIYSYQVERIMGYGTPFEEIEIKTRIPMEDNCLYLIASDDLEPLEPLKLFPLFIVTKNACYFYNHYQKNSIRFVSYHFEEINEISDLSEDIKKILQKLLDLLK